jgi:hypothetical protein
MTKLGLSVKEFGDGSQVKVKPEPAKITEWKAIESKFDEYLTKQLERSNVLPEFVLNLKLVWG